MNNNSTTNIEQLAPVLITSKRGSFNLLTPEQQEAIDYIIDDFHKQLTNNPDFLKNPIFDEDRKLALKDFKAWKEAKRAAFASQPENVLEAVVKDYELNSTRSVKFSDLKPEEQQAIDSYLEEERKSLLQSNDPAQAEQKKLALNNYKKWKEDGREYLANRPQRILDDMVQMHFFNELDKEQLKTPVFDSLSKEEKDAINYLVDKQHKELVGHDPADKDFAEKNPVGFAKDQPEIFKAVTKEAMAKKSPEERAGFVQKYNEEQAREKAKGQLKGVSGGIDMDTHHAALQVRAKTNSSTINV